MQTHSFSWLHCLQLDKVGFFPLLKPINAWRPCPHHSAYGYVPIEGQWSTSKDKFTKLGGTMPSLAHERDSGVQMIQFWHMSNPQTGGVQISHFAFAGGKGEGWSWHLLLWSKICFCKHSLFLWNRVETGGEEKQPRQERYRRKMRCRWPWSRDQSIKP